MRDILVLSQSTSNFGSEADVASRLAAQMRAQLTGLYVIERFQAPATYDPAVLAMLEQEVSALREEAIRAAEGFKRFAGKRGCNSARWHVATGSLVQSAARVACWHDIVVACRDDASPLGSRRAIGDLLLGMRTPMLLVPYSYDGAIPFAQVTIAFNGSVESVRALRAAVPLAATAKKVVLLHAVPEDSIESTPFGPAASLAMHGIDVEERSIPAELSGERFMQVVESTEPDLLVMGGYGRSRFSEWVTGGATRSALSSCPVPVFLAH